MFKRLFGGLFGGLGGLLGRLPLINSVLGIFGLKNLVLLGGLVGSFSVAYLSFKNVTNTIYKEHRRVYDKISNLETEVAEKDIENQKLNRKINSLKTQMVVLSMGFEQVAEALNEIIKNERESRESIKRLEDRLYREKEGKKSLEELAEKRPGLVQKIFNDEMKRLKRCIELFTGSKRGEDEKIDCTDIFGKSAD
jgi:septal ring factor EnvC (AmiA/AmiB activator)